MTFVNFKDEDDEEVPKWRMRTITSTQSKLFVYSLFVCLRFSLSLTEVYFIPIKLFYTFMRTQTSVFHYHFYGLL